MSCSSFQSPTSQLTPGSRVKSKQKITEETGRKARKCLPPQPVIPARPERVGQHGSPTKLLQGSTSLVRKKTENTYRKKETRQRKKKCRLWLKIHIFFKCFPSCFKDTPGRASCPRHVLQGTRYLKSCPWKLLVFGPLPPGQE